jgi:phage gp29-like protein
LASLLRPEQSAFPDQAELDRAIDAFDPAELQRQAEALISPIVALIQEGSSLDEIRAEFLTRYPQMDAKRLETLLERAYFASDLWGELNARRDAGAG